MNYKFLLVRTAITLLQNTIFVLTVVVAKVNHVTHATCGTPVYGR